MKILIISAVYLPEPVVSAKVSFDIAQKLSDKNKIIVACPPPSRPNNFKFSVYEESNSNIERVVLNSYVHPSSSFLGRLKESYSFGVKVKELISKLKDDISVIYLVTWPFFSEYFTLNAAKKHKLPIVLSITDIYPESMIPRLGLIGKIIEYPLRKIDGFYKRKATCIVSISERTKRYLSYSRNIPKSKISVIRVWQEDSIFQDFLSNTNVNFIITFMFVGSISPAANVPYIIRSFLKAKIKNARLVVAGDGSDKDKCRILSQCHDNISFCSVKPDQVPYLQSQSDVLLLALNKGIAKTASPSKLPAYMFSEKPVIASLDLDSDAADIITDSGCGYVCFPNNEVLFSEKMQKMASLNSSQRKLMGEKGREYAIEKLSKATNLNLITDLLESNFKKE